MPLRPVNGQLRLTSYDEVRDAFRQEELRQALYDEASLVLADALLTLHGAPHRARRRLETRLFRLETLRGYERDVIAPAIEETIRPYLDRGQLDLVEMSERVTLDLTALIAGVDRPRGTAAESERLLQFVRAFSRGATVAHAAGDRAAVRAEVGSAMESFDAEFFQPSLARRRDLVARVARGGLAESALPRDVLTVLVQNRDRLDLPVEVLRREIAGYLQAGSHSTAMAFTDTMHELFQWLRAHPQEGDRLRHDLLWVQACVHESLRLHPASPVAKRRAERDVTLSSGRPIPAGSEVVLDLIAANQDPSVFGADSAAFRPARPVPPGVPPWGLSFGAGVHACIGQVLDGGLDATHQRPDPAERNHGSIALLVQAMFQHRVRHHPEEAPERDQTSIRPHWGRYPVVAGELGAPA